MPELPDVEVFKRNLDATSLHQKIEKVQVTDPRILSGISERSFSRKLKGHELERTHRRGKHLFADFNDKSLVLHFGMTGELKYYKQDSPPDHAKVIFLFDNQYRLAYISSRMLGKVRLADSASKFIRQEKLGPDVLEITTEDFAGILEKSRGKIKSALMNQKSLAGLGNLYTDEILFQSGIHPETPVDELSTGRIKTLYQIMHKVLQKAIEKQAKPEDMPRTYLLSHRKKDGGCPKCRGTFETIKVSGRTTYYCPNCQE